MQKNQFISVFLLTLFLYTQIEKMTHDHQYADYSSSQSSKSSLHKPHEKCPICHFQFSSFSVPSFEYNFYNPSKLFVLFIPSPSAIVYDLIYLPSDRGPPIS